MPIATATSTQRDLRPSSPPRAAVAASPASVADVTGASRARRTRLAFAIVVAVSLGARPAAAVVPTTANPILFVTRVPVGGFGSSTAVFGNQGASPDEAPRGGDLVLRLPDGTLRFLTAEAGYGTDGMQGPNAIAVPEPWVPRSAAKEILSTVVGAPTTQ